MNVILVLEKYLVFLDAWANGFFVSSDRTIKYAQKNHVPGENMELLKQGAPEKKHGVHLDRGVRRPNLRTVLRFGARAPNRLQQQQLLRSCSGIDFLLSRSRLRRGHASPPPPGLDI